MAKYARVAIRDNAVCCGIQVSKKKIEELKAKCLADGFTEVPAI